MEKFGPLVTPAWLSRHLHEPNLRIVDFRWYLNHETGLGSSGRPAFDKGHVPGAIHIDLEALSGHQPEAGRHPLPAPETFEQAMRDAGINHDSRVVIYDDEGGLAASRLWWMLRYFGHDTAAVLDGGYPAWSGPVVAGAERAWQGDFVALSDAARNLDYEEVRGLPSGVILIDARRKSRYLGESEPVEPRAGHIPGARSAYWRENLATDDAFKTPNELRSRFEELGIEDGTTVVAYCASGVSACHNLLAMEVAGLGRGRLYAGSWSDWSRRADAPLATGDESRLFPRDFGEGPHRAHGPRARR
jgi:thiosulfate/3-mercaptopyruvate sulfurtransferase